jgi:hypothetical protein
MLDWKSPHSHKAPSASGQSPPTSSHAGGGDTVLYGTKSELAAGGWCTGPCLSLLMFFLCDPHTKGAPTSAPPHDCFTSYNLAPDHPQPVREGEEVTESRQHCPNKRGHVATPGRLQVASWTTESACGVGRLPRAAAERPPMAKGISSRTRPGFSLENSSGAEGRAPCKRPPSL